MVKIALILLALSALAISVTGAYSSNSSSSSSNSSSGAYGVNFFADSENTYYDGYQQSWRYLGWYVHCGSPSDRYNGDGSRSGSQDSDESRYQGNMFCQRYLMWAAVSKVNTHTHTHTKKHERVSPQIQGIAFSLTYSLYRFLPFLLPSFLPSSLPPVH
jgi:hypothetical protein